MELTIEYMYGENDQFHVDSCHVTENSLIYKNKSGEYSIPLSNIKRYKIYKMEREDAIKIAKGLRTDFKCESETMVDFCNTVIKALDQTPLIELVLKKIKDEITKEAYPERYYEYRDYSDSMIVCLEDVYKIIDKHIQNWGDNV